MEHAGAPIPEARLVMILVHGRGAVPRSILELAPRFDRPGVAYVAPAAASGTWYPNSFLAVRARNEPGISSGLFVLRRLVHDLVAQGVPTERIILSGFSQGGCLTSEFALRHPRRYGGVVIFSGGLIGPPGTSWPDPPGQFSGSPVFLGCSDVDSHVPATRVLETEIVFRQMGARVTCRLYPGMGHLVNDDEIEEARRIMDAAMTDAGGSTP